MNYIWSHDNKRYNAIILSHNNAGYGWGRTQRRTKSSGYSIKFGLLFQHQTKPDSNAHCFAISFLERGMTLSLISGLVKKICIEFWPMSSSWTRNLRLLYVSDYVHPPAYGVVHIGRTARMRQYLQNSA